MAQSSWPFENIDTTETQFSQWARNIGEGVKPGTADELEPFADSSGLNVKVRAGESLVRGHYYRSTATETLTITTADPSNPRIDAVVLELDPTANSIVLKVIAGTPASSPVAPTLTQTDGAVYQQLLAHVDVAASAVSISSGDVTDLRTFLVVFDGTVQGSGVIGSITTATLPAANIVTSVSDKSADYAIQAGDKNTYIRLTGSTGRTFTIDNVLAVGESVNFIQDGSGQITFLAGSGVTLQSVDNKLKTNKQYSGATVVCVASGQYRLVGDLAA
jgi:hypothetical protein